MLVLATLAMGQLSTIAKAQDDAPDAQNQDQNQEQAQDPPGRVARLNFSQGSISFRPAGEDDWVSGVPNRPMVTGDDLWADENSRAEVHIGSTAIRLGAKTGITFLTLDDRTTQIRLAQGSLILRVRHVDDEDNYEIDTPNIALNMLAAGRVPRGRERGRQSDHYRRLARPRPCDWWRLYLDRCRRTVRYIYRQRAACGLRSWADS